jgi:tetratricopeptide (TPR) repeat protein
LDAFTQAARLTRDHPPAKAEVLLKRARARERSGAYSVALGETTRARRLVEGRTESEARELLGKALGLSALIRQAQQRPRLALHLARQAADAADSIDDEMALATAWRVMDWSYFMLGEPDAAVHSLKAIEVYHRLGALHEEAGVANNLGGFSYFKGDWGEALEYYSRGQKAAKRVGNMVDAASTGANIAEVLLNQGRYDEAEGPLLEARRVYLASGFFEGVAFTELLLGRMYGIRDDHETAETTLKTSIQHLEDLGLAGWSFEASIHLADATCRSGFPDDALTILTEAEAEAPPEYVEYYGPLLARVRGSILDSAGQAEESVDTLEAGIQLAEERDDTYEHGLLTLTLARVARDRTLAEERQKARDALRTLGVRSVPGVSLRA